MMPLTPLPLFPDDNFFSEIIEVGMYKPATLGERRSRSVTKAIDVSWTTDAS